MNNIDFNKLTIGLDIRLTVLGQSVAVTSCCKPMTRAVEATHRITTSNELSVSIETIVSID